MTSLLLAFSAFLTACQSMPFDRSALDIPSGSVLFQDDFSDPDSGWDRQSGEQGTLDYANDAYRIEVKQSDRMLWSGPGLQFADVRVEMLVTKTAGEMDDQFGIICRAKDAHNFYFLAISSDGYYGIGKVVDGVQNLIGYDAMPPSEMIVQGKFSNHLRADCVGDAISLYANGALLQTVQDNTFPTGEVGLFAGTLAAPYTDIRFDSFSVLKP